VDLMGLHAPVDNAPLFLVSSFTPISVGISLFINNFTEQCATVGGSLSLTEACPSKGDTSCQLLCQDPTDGHQCVVLQAQLIDGSPCGEHYFSAVLK